MEQNAFLTAECKILTILFGWQYVRKIQNLENMHLSKFLKKLQNYVI